MRARLLADRPVESAVIRVINSLLAVAVALGFAVVAADGWGLLSLFFR